MIQLLNMLQMWENATCTAGKSNIALGWTDEEDKEAGGMDRN